MKEIYRGEIKVRIQNPNNEPLDEYYLQLKGKHYSNTFDIHRRENGEYWGYLYACDYQFDRLHPNPPGHHTIPYNGNFLEIEPVQFEIKKDTIISLDIYVNGNMDIQTTQKENLVLRTYPNPIIENSFYYETALPVKSTNSIIEIIGNNGKMIGQYPIVENNGKITLPQDIVTGIYTVRLIVNKKNYATTKIIVP